MSTVATQLAMSLKVTLPFSYSGSIEKSLEAQNFDDDTIPKHILGAFIDFNLTKRRIDQYYDELKEHAGNPNFELQKWASLSPLEKEGYESNLQVLRLQQSLVKNQGPACSVQVSPPAEVNRSTLSSAFARLSRGAETTGSKRKSTNEASEQAKKKRNISAKEEDEDIGDEVIKQYGPWTSNEDKLLLDAVNEYGKQFAMISREVFHGERKDTACRNRYNRVSAHTFYHADAITANEY